MIAGPAIEQSKENFNNIHLKLEEQLVVQSSLDGVDKTRKWNVKPSKFALNTTNPIRAIVEHLNVQPNPEKAFIPLSVGKNNLSFYLNLKHNSLFFIELLFEVLVSLEFIDECPFPKKEFRYF